MNTVVHLFLCTFVGGSAKASLRIADEKAYIHIKVLQQLPNYPLKPCQSKCLQR